MTMPVARIDLMQGKAPDYRAAVADIVFRGIVDVLKAPDGDRFIVISEHTPDNLIYDPDFLGWKRSADFLLNQVTSTVGNDKASKLAFFRYVADQVCRSLGLVVRQWRTLELNVQPAPLSNCPREDPPGVKRRPVRPDGRWRRGDPGVARCATFPWIASLRSQ
jgi:phenylpyruvate tautomerase PptA (4-oxalocrotonate tautomerase family)